MMFGWTGLACIRQFNCKPLDAVLYATGIGAITIVLTAFIFKWAQHLVSLGEQFNIEKTINTVGVVYQRISGNKPGKIQVIVNGMTRELLACSLDGTDMESFQMIRVVGVLDIVKMQRQC